MNLPSVKTLMRIEGMDRDRAKLLRKVLELKKRDDAENMIGCIGQPGLFPVTAQWRLKLYNAPSISEIKMQLANEIIDGFGIEYTGEVDMRNGPPLEYVNLGDTYDVTLCRFRGRYVVSSWGDIVERHERLFRDF
ncbi:MAG: hypothetical protein BWY66_00367 [bacterium ADurb.Bin374]|nr:MAG: hypothetical protein BWY66_00367 [bacterium ADurb.Bin374]